MRTALGGVSKDFNLTTSRVVENRKEIDKSRDSVDRHGAAFGRFSKNIIVANQALSLMGKTIAILKIPVFITLIGYAAQAINVLLAGVLALGGALGTLSGLIGAAPAALLTLGGAVLSVKLAFSGLTEAMNGNEEAFKKLTPEAKEFVSTLNGLKPVIKDIRREAQRGLFPGLTEALQNIFSERNIGIFRRNIRAFGKAVGDTAAEFGRMVNQGGFAKDLNFLLSSAAKNFRIVGDAGVRVVDAIRNIAVAAQPLANYITQLVGRFGRWIQQTTEAGRQSGALARFFAQTKQTLQELGRILGPVGSALATVFKVATPFGHLLLQQLGGAAEQLQKVTNAAKDSGALKGYFQSAMAPLKELGRLVRDVIHALLTIGAQPGLTQLIKILRVELVPVLRDILVGVANGFGPAVAKLAVEIAKLIKPIVGSSGPLTAFVKALTGIVQFINFVIQKVPLATHIMATFFGIMAVNKVLPIVSGIRALGVALAGTTVAADGTAVSIRGIRAALISTGIGAALVAIGVAAELIIQHWDKVGPYFRALFITLVEGVKAAAYQMLYWMTLPIRGFLKALSLIPDRVPIFGKAGDEATKALNAINGVMDKLKPNLDKVRDAWSSIGDATDRATQSVNQYAQAVVQGSALGPVAPGAVLPTGKGGDARRSVAPAGSITSVGGEHPTAGLAGFPALDVMVRPGTPVISPVNGRIVKTSGGPGVRDAQVGVAGYSVYIAADNGDTYFLTHLGNLAVKVGQKVVKGQVLGVVFDWGGRTHVHVGRRPASSPYTPPATGTPPATTSPAGFTSKAPTFDDKTKPTPAAEVEVRAAKQRIDYIAKHVSQISDFPKVQANVRRQVQQIRQMWKDALKDGVITDDELTKIQNRIKKLQSIFQRGLALEQIIHSIRRLKGSLRNLWADVQKELAPDNVTPDQLMAKFNRLIAQAMEAARRGLLNRAKRLRDAAAQVRRDLVAALVEGIQNARSRVADAISSVMDAALSEFDRKTEKLVDAARKAVDSAFGVSHGETAAARRLRQFREARDAEAFAKSVSDAQKELADAEAALQKVRADGSTPEEIQQAEERVLAAREAIRQLDLDAQERALQQEADAQEQAYQDALTAAEEQTRAEREALRVKLAERLAMIQKNYDDEKITAEEAQQEIMALLGEYGIDTTEAMGATAVFTRALEELGEAIKALAAALRNAREMATPSSKGSNSGNDRPSTPPRTPALIPIHKAAGGFVPRIAGSYLSRDSVPTMLTPGELVLNAAQQQRVGSLLSGGGGGTTVIVTIPNATLLGRSLQVADEIADAVSPAIARRVGYRYPGR